MVQVVWGLTLVVSWLVVQAAAVSPDFHHWLHQEASTAGHVCAAAISQHGGVEPVDHPPLLLRPESPSGPAVIAELCLLPLRSPHTFPLGRAPPVD